MKVNKLNLTIYRMKIRKELFNSPIELLQITKEECIKELERRQKNKKKK